MTEEDLAKDLGPLAALTIGVGTMIGAGIFVLPGDAISRSGSLAGGAFVLGGVIAIFTALSASELGTAMPRSGGAYFYVNRALGPLFGSVAGWANWLGLAFASAFYMVGFGEYVRNILGLATGYALVGVTIPTVKTMAFAGAALFITVNYVGAKETGRLQNIIVVVLLGILTVFTAIGIMNAQPANLPESEGFDAMLSTTGLIFVSYLGFVQITSVAEEIKDPDRNLPRAVIGSVLIVTTVYALVLVVMSAAVPDGFIASLDPDKIAVVEVGRHIQGGVVAGALLLGGLLATASSANASILASSRINFAMGRDRIITPELNEIHDRFGTPYRAIGITGGLILAFILVAPINTLAELGSVLHLVIYGLLNLALIVMREADVENYDPSFTVPLYPFTPILGAVLSFALIVYITPFVRVLGLAVVVFAAAWYLLYARSRTTEAGELADWILSRSDEMPDAAVSAAESVAPDGGQYRVMVPLANPEHEKDLITLASALAKQNDGTVIATHIVTVPDQTTLAHARDNVNALDDGDRDILETARRDAETFGVDVETHTIFSHRAFDEVFDAARTYDADTVVMGWGPNSHGRAESRVDELTTDVPCDFLVLKDRGFDPDHLLVPTAGGPDSDLSAAVARDLRAEYGSTVSLLYVRSDDQTRDEAGEFLADWAVEHDLEDAEFLVDEGDVETAIERHSRDATMLVVGATERGLIDRLLGGTLVMDVVDNVECSVLLAEKKRRRSLKERLLGND
ncbi:amino acid permease [Halorubellus sp. JP-L1]|uniref:amino acid permease n=1 Tax=Halorubellus sp. JP-L1 TaxID=2715753 RepID=UPI00140DF63C|nr:amino acid permease [Halorubellus sp. JP-L1]NHN41244.1 amino acid permease [Halorubellus sp. JP-L1]